MLQHTERGRHGVQGGGALRRLGTGRANGWAAPGRGSAAASARRGRRSAVLRGADLPAAGLTLEAPSLLLDAAADRTVDAESLPLRATAYAGTSPRGHPLLSPLHGDLHGLPPLQLHAAGTEVLPDDALSFATRAAHSGVAVDLRVYEDELAQGLRQSGAMAEFLRAWCRSASSSPSGV